VARACVEHYQPLGPSDSVPSSPVSVAVALADKIDTLTGFWAIDEKPTGSKDPYALRRAALGVIRLVLGYDYRMKLNDVAADAAFLNQLHVATSAALNLGVAVSEALRKMSESTDSFPKALAFLKSFGEKTAQNEFELEVSNVAEKSHPFDGIERVARGNAADLLAFFHDRLKVHLREQGIRHDVIDACLAMPSNDDLTLLVKRAEALSAFLKTSDGENLLQGFKRANNILTKEEAKDGVEYSYGPDAKLAETDEERALFKALDQAEGAITPAMQAEDFAAAMTAMAGLRAPIDAFFEAVQINADNQIVRRNRLNLLHRIRATCLQVADLTRVEG